MYRTFEAIYKEGQVVSLEEIEADEESKILVIVLDNQEKNPQLAGWKSLKGKYKNSLSSVDGFIARKQAKKKLNIFQHPFFGMTANDAAESVEATVDKLRSIRY